MKIELDRVEVEYLLHLLLVQKGNIGCKTVFQENENDEYQLNAKIRVKLDNEIKKDFEREYGKIEK